MPKATCMLMVFVVRSDMPEIPKMGFARYWRMATFDWLIVA